MSAPSHGASHPPTSQRLQAEFRFLSELCQLVAASTDLQPILDWIVEKTTRLLDAEAGSIKLRGPEGGVPTAHTIVSTGRSAELQSGSWPREFTTSVIGHLTMHPEPLATPDIVRDPRFSGLRGSTAPIRAVLAVPLVVENRVTGMLAVTHREPGRRWTADEAGLLQIVASNSAGVIEQARLRAEAQERLFLDQERKRLERELDLAREIQMSLVPAGGLRVGPWAVHGRVVPARQVGGDAFDYFALERDRLAVAIADVAGKGVPAAILMSSVQAQIRAYCTGSAPVHRAIHEVNRSVAGRARSGRFITLFYAEADPAAGVLRYCNAGHNHPLLRRPDGALIGLEHGGPPLGLFEDVEYVPGEVPFAPGDALLLYSDGITEAHDAFQGEFSDARLRAWWSARAGTDPEATVDQLFAEVERFRGAAAPSDDMTAVVVSAAP